MMSDGDDDYDDHDDCDDDDAPASLGVMPQGGRDARGRLPASPRGREAFACQRPGGVRLRCGDDELWRS